MQKLQEDDDVWIAVCTLASVGTGVELQRADHILLFDLTHNWKTVVQLGGRTDRRSQQAKKCVFCILYNSALYFETAMYRSLLYGQKAEEAMNAQVVKRGEDVGRSDTNDVEMGEI